MELSQLHYRALIAFCEGVLLHAKRNALDDLEIFHQTQLHFLLKTNRDFTLKFDARRPNRLTLASDTLLVDFFDNEEVDRKTIMIRTPEE